MSLQAQQTQTYRYLLIGISVKLFVSCAGAATTMVGCGSSEPEITIVKRGEIPITRHQSDNPQRWGYFSAVDFVEDTAWFAVPVALDTKDQYGSWIWSQDCGRSD
jgi:hypothetical protein